jgi:hypothetical protein
VYEFKRNSERATAKQDSIPLRYLGLMLLHLRTTGGGTVRHPNEYKGKSRYVLLSAGHEGRVYCMKYKPAKSVEEVRAALEEGLIGQLFYVVEKIESPADADDPFDVS